MFSEAGQGSDLLKPRGLLLPRLALTILLLVVALKAELRTQHTGGSPWRLSEDRRLEMLTGQCSAALICIHCRPGKAA